MGEQQVVLEHHADRATLGRDERVGRRVVERRSPSMLDRARLDRQQAGEAAQQRRLAGAVRAEHGHHLTGLDVELDVEVERARAAGPIVRRRGVMPPITATAVAPEPPVAQPDEHDERHHDQHQAEHERRRRVGLQGEVDRQRHRLGAPGVVAGERDRRPELTERTGPGEHGAGDQRRADRRQRDPPERVPARAAERARGLLEAAVDLAQRRLHREDEERHRHERLGEHDRRGGERDPEAEPPVEVLAEQARGGRTRRTAPRRRPPAAAPSTACTAPARRRARGRRPWPAPTPGARRTATTAPVAASEHTIDSRSAVTRPRGWSAPTTPIPTARATAAR